MAVGCKDPLISPLELKLKSFLGLKFNDAFSGKACVRWLKQNKFARDEKQAFRIGNEFLKLKLISHCSSDKLPFTTSCYYTLVTPKEEIEKAAQLASITLTSSMADSTGTASRRLKDSLANSLASESSMASSGHMNANSSAQSSPSLANSASKPGLNTSKSGGGFIRATKPGQAARPVNPPDPDSASSQSTTSASSTQGTQPTTAQPAQDVEKENEFAQVLGKDKTTDRTKLHNWRKDTRLASNKPCYQCGKDLVRDGSCRQCQTCTAACHKKCIEAFEAKCLTCDFKSEAHQLVPHVPLKATRCRSTRCQFVKKSSADDDGQNEYLKQGVICIHCDVLCHTECQDFYTELECDKEQQFKQHLHVWKRDTVTTSVKCPICLESLNQGKKCDNCRTFVHKHCVNAFERRCLYCEFDTGFHQWIPVALPKSKKCFRVDCLVKHESRVPSYSKVAKGEVQSVLVTSASSLPDYRSTAGLKDSDLTPTGLQCLHCQKYIHFGCELGIERQFCYKKDNRQRCKNCQKGHCKAELQRMLEVHNFVQDELQKEYEEKFKTYLKTSVLADTGADYLINSAVMAKLLANIHVHTNMNIPILEPLPHHPYIEYLQEVRQCQKDYSLAYKNSLKNNTPKPRYIPPVVPWGFEDQFVNFNESELLAHDTIENYFAYAKKLCDAAGAGNLEALELVLLMAADSDVPVSKFINLPPHGQNYGRNAFHLACQMGHEKIVAKLLYCDRIDIDAQDAQGNTALHLACFGNFETVVAMLLVAGANRNVPNKENRIPSQCCRLEDPNATNATKPFGIETAEDMARKYPFLATLGPQKKQKKVFGCCSPWTCTCQCLVGTKYDNIQKAGIVMAGVALVGGAVALSVGTFGVASPAAAIGVGVGVGVLSGMGITALAQTGVATALGKKIDYLQFAKQMAIGGTIGALGGAGSVGITVATQGVGAIATNAAMIQMVVTPSDGKQIGGMVKNKFQGKAIREQNGMIGYRRNMELEDVKLEDQLRERKPIAGSSSPLLLNTNAASTTFSDSQGNTVILRPSIPTLEARGRTESITSVSLESSNLEKEQTKLLDNLF